MKIITAAAIKGGTGKTTTCAALAQAGAAAGKKILAIDLDPQANLSFFIGADQNKPGTYQLLHGADPAQLIQQTQQGIDAIPASPDLATEKTAPASANRLRTAIEPIKRNYDFIFIDTPPQMGELTFNALQASTGLVIPLETDASSLQGLYQIADIAHQMQTRNNALSILGFIITRYDARANVNKFWRATLAEKGAEIGAPFLTAIRASAAVMRETQGFQRSLYEYAPNSKPAQDYMHLFEMIQEE